MSVQFMSAATLAMTSNGCTIAPARKSVRARFAMRIYEGLCSEGASSRLSTELTSEFKSTGDMDVNEYIVDTAAMR
jgi:hypothetical protein